MGSVAFHIFTHKKGLDLISVTQVKPKRNRNKNCLNSALGGMSFFVSALVSLQALRNEYRLDFLVSRIKYGTGFLYQDKRTMTLAV
jgi:hypothetical protein